MTPEEKDTLRRKSKRIFRTRMKEKIKKNLVKKLAHAGMTKHEYNIVERSKSKLTKETKNKSQQSIKFTKSNQFFTNLQVFKL